MLQLAMPGSIARTCSASNQCSQHHLSYAIRCMKMALVHDVAEAIVGDITPHCQVLLAYGMVAHVHWNFLP